MSINIGDISGCLEIIGDCAESENDLHEIIEQWAQEEWCQFDDRYSFGDENFKSKYKLNKEEVRIYEERGVMPDSFISKFRRYSADYCMIRYMNRDIRFLWHESKPNTRYIAVKGCKKKELYKVKCNTCNRIFYMDEHSFNCVKWRSCIGAKCLKSTVDNIGIDYSHNLYDWSSSEILAMNTELAKAEELSVPLTYYSAGVPQNSLKIAYVSDIHLHHHLKYYSGNAKRMIKDVANKLYQTKDSADIILFVGDISSSSDIVINFFSQFIREYNWKNFKQFKGELNRLKRIREQKNIITTSKYMRCYNNISKYIEKRKNEINDLFDFTIFERYKQKYYPNIVYDAAYEKFQKTKGFKKYEISEQTEVEILDIIRLLNRKDSYRYKVGSHEQKQVNDKFECEKFERKYSKSIEEISLNDYIHIKPENIYVILGNHEYIDFPNVQTCVDFYKRELSKFGITVLHNEYVENEKFLLYGGTGFAKYAEVWNADRVVCCPGFTREDEIRETTLFEKAYKEALKYAKEKGLCFLTASHYPVLTCLNSVFDKEAIYFTGHNHCNEYVKLSDKVLYADNQIGYENNNIAFKIATTGYEVNPYGDLGDGLYQTSVEDYLKFYRYIGEYIGDGKLLYQRCQNGNFYVIKRKGYYGFFIISTQKKSKGISIVNGGLTKKLTNATDIGWICENFDIVVSKYLQMLLPLRKAQEKLSEELKELGLDGTIHGLIVDIDYYHHIAINPVEGSMEFYYSSIWGRVMELNSFDEVIKSLECNGSGFDKYDCKMIRKKYAQKSKGKGYLLNISSNGNLLETESDEMLSVSQRVEHIVSRTEGMYGVSRKISPLQRLFSGRVLRDFDLRLTETKQQPYRKQLYTNRVFMYEGIRYQVIEDDGSDIILVEELQKGSRSKGNAIKLSGITRKFVVTALKSKIKNPNEYNTYWIS